jgi:guanine deaminase
VSRIAHRGAILNFRGDPGDRDDPCSYQYWEQGALIVCGGKVEQVGPAAELLSDAALPVIDHGSRLLLPGFIDTHIHYPQTDVIAAGGRHLLEWLERYTFPAEQRFADPEHARAVAHFFCDELLRNGTTTAQVLGTAHSVSVNAFFEVAAGRALRMIAGKALMDRLCPDGLRDVSAADAERDTRTLIERWHGRDRLHYAITPRFALTSSEAQLESCGRLAREFPDVFIHSHLAENRQEVSEVCAAFPQRRSYLDVYDHYGLLRERATFAHCIYLDAIDRGRLAASGAGAAFCPSSNLYLGSGLFDIATTDAAKIPFALATDVGGGSSFSMLRTMGEAYKVAQLTGQILTPLRAFYLATLAGARQLRLQDRIGSFTAGHEADFIVLDPAATPLLARRMDQCRDLSERLRLWMILGDDRAVAHTYVLGRRACFKEMLGAKPPS